MATDSKDFKIKNGLIVQGATATVNGNNVITEASSIADVSDVDTSGATDLQALVYNASTGTWIPGEAVGGGSGSYTISATAPESPEAGDVWFDSTDGKSYIYYEDVDTSQWLEIGSRQPGPTGATGATGPQGEPGRFTTSDTEPPNPVDGDVWFNTSNGAILVYYTDADSSQWVESGYPVLGYQTIAGLTDTQISSLQDGEALVYDSTAGKWINQIIDPNPYNKSTNETGFLALPVGGDSDRPVTPANGYIRFNTDLGEPEWYSESESKWVLFRQSKTDLLEYLVVAGGGGGGRTGTNYGSAAGGGAGGYRSSIVAEGSGGGSVAEDRLAFSLGQSFNIEIGAGGNGGGSTYGTVVSGSDSSFGTIVSTGGGRGADPGGTTPGGVNAESGGSGGGATSGNSPGSGTAGQGYSGGSGSGGNYTGGGGGGAGSPGSSGVVGSAPASGGLGGSGLSSNVTGSSVTRAAGGPANVQNAPGAGNTGNGGSCSQPGGSGIIILKYPSSYTLSASVGISSSTATLGDYKVTQFTAGTGTVTFS